jgi:hypothetical protein
VQFDYARDNVSGDDIIALMNADTVFTIDSGWVLENDIIGFANDPSRVSIKNNQGDLYLLDVQLDNLEIWALPFASERIRTSVSNTLSVINDCILGRADDTHYYWIDVINDNGGTLEITNCLWKGTPSGGGRLSAQGESITILDGVHFERNYTGISAYAFDPPDSVSMYNCSFDISHMCRSAFSWFGVYDPPNWYTSSDFREVCNNRGVVVNIHSWEGDGKAYSYDDFGFYEAGNMAHWIAGDSLVVLYRVYNEDVEGVLEYGNNDCTTYSVDMEKWNDVGLTWLYAKDDISWATGTPRKSVWYNVEAKLCWKEINSGCAVKNKPKVPDYDPPIPQQH